VVLVQDYHFALVPRLVRDRRADASIGIFWHIPFPAPDTFAIFPWKSQLLDGLLAADVIGFHTREYCRNFLETVAQLKPALVDLHEMTAAYRGHRTLVRPYPISVEWPYSAASREDAAAIRKTRGIADGVHVSIGVDRADYTKGILERVDAVDRLLTQNPSLAGKYVLVQLASPSRTRIAEYNDLLAKLNARVEDVNRRHGSAGYRPIQLDVASFSRRDVRAHYAMAQSALVTPLHDGMNLVAKEFVAANIEGDGVLILSRFAGAAQELGEALLVNPYDVQDISSAIFRAIHMLPNERRARMSALRERVAANTIYDWSARLVGDVARHRVEAAKERSHDEAFAGDRL
jgi:trehalose 6-phosphate synthase